MRFQFVAVLLIASICGAQTPMAVPPSAANVPAQTPSTPVTPSGAITVAQETSIPMTLLSPIKSKSTKPGDAVRAVVAFPVTVGTQIAIPSGTFVEGVVNAVTARAPKTHVASVQIHFTRMLFANGYSVTLDAANTDAKMIAPDSASQFTYEIADARDGAPLLGEGFGAAGQTTPLPPLQPPPSVGPSPGVIVGATVGATAGLVVLLLVLSHQHGNADYVLFDNGWQFQMALDSPLTLDAARVAAAAATPMPQ